MDRGILFAELRKRGSAVFGAPLSQPQVEGTEVILDSCVRHNVTDPHHAAHCLAEVYHETGGYMLGIKETVMPSHKDKRPGDETVKARLEAAWKAGRLPWVKTPYWRDGGFGRGPIQLTTWPNYERMGKRLGVDLRDDPDLALDPNIGADIAVVGMSEGLFTGRRLSDYPFPSALEAPPAQHPRRIVNGKDGTDAEVSRYHRAFHAALIAAGFSEIAELLPSHAGCSSPPVREDGKARRGPELVEGAEPPAAPGEGRSSLAPAYPSSHPSPGLPSGSAAGGHRGNPTSPTGGEVEAPTGLWSALLSLILSLLGARK